MKIKLLAGCLFLLSGFVAQAQDDTTYYYTDSLYTQLEGQDSTEYEDDYSDASYTISDPAQLPITQQHIHDTYSKKEFDKTKWKEIVGDTDYTEEKTKEKKATSFSPVWNPAYLKILGFVIIFILALVILAFLVKNAFNDEKLNKNTQDFNSLLSDDANIDHIQDQDIDALLKQALAAKDFRAAVRLYYIRLLKHLNSSNYILWKKDKTNRDYTFELSSTAFVQDFRKITIAYEIIWYGERTPSAHEFETLQKNFSEIQTKTTQLN